MAENAGGEKSLEMRVADLEDKLKGMQITEDEMRAYNKVAMMLSGGQMPGAEGASTEAVGSAQANLPNAGCVVNQCAIRACTIVQQCTIRACTVVQQCIRACTVVQQCTVIQQCTIRACTIIQDCINECGGGCAPGGGGFNGGGFGTLGG